jgi:hypothetical protein
VWSVWFNTVDLFIGATYSMLKVAQKPAILVPHPASLPLDRVLGRMREAAQASAPKHHQNKLNGARLRVMLGSSICPPINFTPPKGIKNWQELQLAAHANAVQSLGRSLQPLQCEYDANVPGVTTSMPLPWIQNLHSWAKTEHAKIVSIKPIWAVATQSKLVRAKAVRALWLQEPEGITLVSCQQPSSTQAQGQLAQQQDQCIFLSNSVSAENTDAALLWVAKNAVSQQSTLKLAFSDAAKPLITGAPPLWRDHWSRA